MRIGTDAAIVSIVIPCLNEASAIGPLVAELVAAGLDEVVVVDGGSSDGTAGIAAAAGAKVVVEARRGYGRACAVGVEASRRDAEILAFIDGDGSDDPAGVGLIVGPMMRNDADLTIASRLRGSRESGSMTKSQVLAGRLAGLLLRLVYDARFTDMAPFRAMRRDRLAGLGMREMTFGWNLEMQMRVAARGLRVLEVPVRCRRRAGGLSKVSGNTRASLAAAASLIATFVRLAVTLRRERLS